MFGGPHQKDEVKRAEQLGWSTKTERRLRQGARCTKCRRAPERVYTQESKNLTESLLTRPTSLDMSPVSCRHRDSICLFPWTPTRTVSRYSSSMPSKSYSTRTSTSMSCLKLKFGRCLSTIPKPWSFNIASSSVTKAIGTFSVRSPRSTNFLLSDGTPWVNLLWFRPPLACQRLIDFTLTALSERLVNHIVSRAVKAWMRIIDSFLRTTSLS